ncbi:MAG: YoaK family protein [Candidatus Dormibacteraceae bacterium]
MAPKGSRSGGLVGAGLATAAMMTVVGGFIDAYTYLSHGVFARAQTGNVIFLAVGVVQDRPFARFLWPILAYAVGVLLAHALRLASSARTRWALAAAIGAQVLVLVVIGTLPTSTAMEAVVLPLSAIGGLQLALFRSAGGITFVSIATTGNLMRFIEAATAAFRRRSREQVRVMAFTALIVAAFAAGAFAGAGTTRVVGHSGIWGAALLQLVVLALFLWDSDPARTPPGAAVSAHQP